MDNLEALKQLIIKLPQKQIATFCCYLLLAAFCYQSAVLTWQLWPEKSESVTSWQPVFGQDGKQIKSYELNTLRNLHLFGLQQTETQAPVVVQNIDAPKTRLRLILAGLVASSEPSLALAIIELKGKQDTYGIEDEIGSTDAVLKQVLVDRVIIKYKGNLETLMLDGEEFTRETSGRQPHNESSSKAPRDLSNLRKDLLANPASITDYVRISPVRTNGKLAGYRVNPGKNRELFKEVGLKPNDLAVSLNGYDLTDTRQAMEVAKQLKDLTEMSLTVERDGQLHSIYLSMPE
ncbi:type II secretion system protein GspC [Moritella viscosa]|uniref:General secretion pathway protein C n=1 Tax=Moritella viscosa TaxID=80854 RepID=A0ABY1HIN1_9GAMM|nr:type II secretion system protein GspC [Moritella viscosa]CED58297.1 general secretion pathway protein C [Moritella viscosa]SGY94901.1 General secretion pathway protein C [Moritella viscosa]SGZ00060.1 General secretion pathway protein C [Moritella viscosa]SGZ06684.1 General secretion pathway protein C [Moritella viscosa]SHO10378.1 General secretion pathway protein C [Moritella viscosa]